MEPHLKEFYEGKHIKPELKFTCSEESCPDNLCNNEEHGREYTQDPVGSHIAELFVYYHMIKDLSLQLNDISMKNKHLTSSSENEQHLNSCPVAQPSCSSRDDQLSCTCANVSKPQPDSSQSGELGTFDLNEEEFYHTPLPDRLLPPDIPSFPQKYPFKNSVDKILHPQKYCSEEENASHYHDPWYPCIRCPSFNDYVRRKILIKSKTNLKQEEVNQELKYCVERILLQSGFDSYNIGTVRLLYDMLKMFLRKLMELMMREKKTDNLLALVDRVLFKAGSGGIHGIHEFYFTQVRIHDLLYKDCVDIRKKCLELRREIIDNIE